MEKIKIFNDFLSMEEIINPTITYEGSFSIDSQLLMPAAKVKNNTNLFKQFLLKRYYSKIGDYFHKGFTTYIKEYPPTFKTIDVSDTLGGGRKLIWDINYFLFLTLHFFYSESYEIKEIETILASLEKREEKIKFTKIKLKEIRKSYKEALLLKKNSQVYDKLMSDLEWFRKEKKNPYLTLEYLVDNWEQFIKNIILNLEAFVLYLETPIDLQELEECFDLDKFYLIFGYILNIISIKSLQTQKEVHNSFIYCSYLAFKIEEIKRKNASFIYKTEIMSVESNRISYTTEDFLKKYQEISFLAPNFILKDLSQENIDLDQMKKHKYIEELRNKFSDRLNYLQSNWEFLPPGKKLSIEKENTKKILNIRNRNKEKQYQNIRRCKLFLDQTNFLFRIVGKNLFEGYIGYIYGNGNVIFEKFYQNSKTGLPALENATYKMRFDNFVEMSKIHRLHLLIKEKNSAEIKKICHDHRNDLRDWFKQMIELTNGNKLEQEVKEYIENFVDTKKRR